MLLAINSSTPLTEAGSVPGVKFFFLLLSLLKDEEPEEEEAQEAFEWIDELKDEKIPVSDSVEACCFIAEHLLEFVLDFLRIKDMFGRELKELNLRLNFLLLSSGVEVPSTNLFACCCKHKESEESF